VYDKLDTIATGISDIKVRISGMEAKLENNIRATDKMDERVRVLERGGWKIMGALVAAIASAIGMLINWMRH